MKHLDTLLILAAAAAGLYFLSKSLKSTANQPQAGGNASSLNNYGNLPITNGGGFSNLPNYLIFP